MTDNKCQIEGALDEVNRLITEGKSNLTYLESRRKQLEKDLQTVENPDLKVIKSGITGWGSRWDDRSVEATSNGVEIKVIFKPIGCGPHKFYTNATLLEVCRLTKTQVDSITVEKDQTITLVLRKI